MKYIFLILIGFPFIGNAQKVGIKFENNLSLKQIFKKAHSTNKYLFLDCYATWCGPCKMMDKGVYSNDSVGQYLNSNFISVRIQMDTARKDDSKIRQWYNDANSIGQKYKVTSYPTYLFISPQGKIVHKGIGYLGVNDFIKLSSDAINPKRQYYTLLENYNSNKSDYSCMLYLSNTAVFLGDTSMGFEIGKAFINHLLNSNDSNMFTKENVEFIRQYTKSSEDKYFKLFYSHSNFVNKLMEDTNYSQTVVEYIISKENIDPHILAAIKSNLDSPDWSWIKWKIEQQYNTYYADRTIAAARVRWYGWKKNWPEFTASTVQLVSRFGMNMSGFDLDLHAWHIFQYSNSADELKAAISWIERALNEGEEKIGFNWPNYLDTYANLLYKTGLITKALEIENKALKFAPDHEDIKFNLQKMKNRVPTWPNVN